MASCRRSAGDTLGTSSAKGNSTDEQPDHFARLGRHAGSMRLFVSRTAAASLTASGTTATGLGIRRLPRTCWVAPGQCAMGLRHRSLPRRRTSDVHQVTRKCPPGWTGPSCYSSVENTFRVHVGSAGHPRKAVHALRSDDCAHPISVRARHLAGVLDAGVERGYSRVAPMR